MPDSINMDLFNTQDHYRELQLQSAAQRAAATQDAKMGMQDFIRLLVAQLQNQDMMNPMQDTEFIGQMAQFSTLQAISAMSELNTTTYALSMIGKEVEAARIDKVTGQMIRTQGVVTGVTLFEGRPVIYIGDTAFDLENIMTVGTFPKTEDPTEPPEEVKPPVDPDRYGFELDDDGNPIDGFLIDSQTGYRLDLETGEVTDPETGNQVYLNPETGELTIEPDMGDAPYIFGRDPDSGYLVDPDSGWLIHPGTGKLVDPTAEPEETEAEAGTPGVENPGSSGGEGGDDPDDGG